MRAQNAPRVQVSVIMIDKTFRCIVATERVEFNTQIQKIYYGKEKGCKEVKGKGQEEGCKEGKEAPLVLTKRPRQTPGSFCFYETGDGRMYSDRRI